MKQNHYIKYFKNIIEISKKIDIKVLDSIITTLCKVKRNKGRVFFIGAGGSAGNCSHAVNDFRKLCLIEAYAPTDNVSELTARVNDEGWETVFSEWFKISNLNSKDSIFILSVGGGDKKKNISQNLIEAIKYAKKKKVKILGIVGRDGGYTKKNGDNIILVPNIDNDLVTPLSESFQSVILHCIVSSPRLQSNKTKW